MEFIHQKLLHIGLPPVFLPQMSQLHHLQFSLIMGNQGLINTPPAPTTAVSKNTSPVNSFSGPFKHFQSHSQPCIILQSRKQVRPQKLKPLKAEDSESQTKSCSKKQLQKETRNVASNLLRIFLKNILELRFYGATVQKILEKSGNPHTSNQFYEWLEHFNINFKNYIKIGEIKKILAHKEPRLFRRIFVTLLSEYAHMTGVAHCLTSRRIEKRAIKMHMRGLQDLKRSLLSLYREHQH